MSYYSCIIVSFQKRRRKTIEVKISESKMKVFMKHPLSVVLQVLCEGMDSNV